MTLAPESFAGRAIALAIPLLAGALVITFALLPVFEAFEARMEDTAREHRLYEAFAARVASSDLLRGQLISLKAQAGSNTGYLSGADAALAGSALQGNVRRILVGTEGAMRSLQVLPPTVENGLQKIGVRIDAALPANRLLDLLYELETADPYLFTDSLDIRPPDSGTVAPLSPSAQISVRADIYGYLQINP